MQHVVRWVLLLAEHLVQWVNPAPCVLASVFVALMQVQPCGGLGAVRVIAAICRPASVGVVSVVGTAVLRLLIFKQRLRASFNTGRALSFLLWHQDPLTILGKMVGLSSEDSCSHCMGTPVPRGALHWCGNMAITLCFSLGHAEISVPETPAVTSRG